MATPSTIENVKYECPERKVYNFIKDYLSDKKYINKIEIGKLHYEMTKHCNDNNNGYDIDGIDNIFPWRKRGYVKFLDFVKSIPGLKFTRSIDNNHCVQIDNDKFENIEPFFNELEKIKIKVDTVNQRKQKRIDRKRWRHKKQDRSFHNGFDVLLKLPFLSLKNDINDDENIKTIRDSFYSQIINDEDNKETNYNINSLNNINWDNVPNNLCPEQIILSSRNRERRGTWKKQQIETFYEILKCIINENDKNIKTIIDFGCGSGNIGLALAFLFPKYKFILIDYNPYCLKIVNNRININKLTNVECIQCKINDIPNDIKFEIGIACHCCGNATDQAQQLCFKNNAQFILCSCCVGKIEDGPQSKIFKKIITKNEYNKLSSIADHSSYDNNNIDFKNNNHLESRKLCKTILEIDRCFNALETNKYKYCILTQIIPYNSPNSTSPKNDVIIGTNSENIVKLFNDNWTKINKVFVDFSNV